MLRIGRIKLKLDLRVTSQDDLERKHSYIAKMIELRARLLFQDRVVVSVRSREGSLDSTIDFLKNISEFAAAGVTIVAQWSAFVAELGKLTKRVHDLSASVPRYLRKHFHLAEDDLVLRISDEDYARVLALTEIVADTSNGPRSTEIEAMGPKAIAIHETLKRVGTKRDREIIFQGIRRELPFWPNEDYEQFEERVETVLLPPREPIPSLPSPYTASKDEFGENDLAARPAKKRKKYSSKTRIVVDPNAVNPGMLAHKGLRKKARKRSR